METYEVTVEMNFKDKIINFWYHYKWQTLGVIFILFVLIVSIITWANKPNPDITIVYVSEATLLDSQRAELKETFASKISDYNKDDKSQVEIIEIDLPPDRGTIKSSSMQRLMAELAVAENFFFMVDDTGLEILNANEALRDISNIANNTIKDNKAISLETTSIFKTVMVNMPQNYYGTIRIYGDKMSKKQTQAISASNELIKNLSK